MAATAQELERKRALINIRKVETVIEETELNIMEMEAEIERKKAAMAKHQEYIQKERDKLAALTTPTKTDT